MPSKFVCPKCGGRLALERDALAQHRINKRTGAVGRARLLDYGGSVEQLVCTECYVEFSYAKVDGSDRIDPASIKVFLDLRGKFEPERS